jgi:hypothetical protein
VDVYVEYLGYSVELPHGETIVGRDTSCGLRFHDPSVSRRHVKLVREGDAVFVEDLGSSNGTEVNGRTIHGRVALHDGDRIGLGSRVLELRVGGDDADDSPTRRVASLRDLSELERPDATNSRSPTTKIDLGGLRSPKVTWRPGDRRRHMRRSMELDLVYTSSELEIEATTRDLSQAGVFVNTQVLDPLGTHCRLEIKLDGAAPLRIAGVVRHVVDRPSGDDDTVGLGIEFRDVSEDARRWLAMAIARMTAEAG